MRIIHTAHMHTAQITQNAQVSHIYLDPHHTRIHIHTHTHMCTHLRLVSVARGCAREVKDASELRNGRLVLSHKQHLMRGRVQGYDA